MISSRRLPPGGVLLLQAALLVVCALSACGGDAEAGDGLPRVVCTTGMVTDVVRRVAGDGLRVTGIMGTGVDPHLYKPTRGDVRRILSADLVFYSGLLLEGHMGRAFAGARSRGRPVFAVTEELDAEHLYQPPGHSGQWDPHVWMDVGSWSSTVAVVERRLSAAFPGQRAAFARNASDLRTELGLLDHYVRETVKTIPENARVLVTAHDAFHYFGRAYGVEVLAIQGISTDSAASVADIRRLVTVLVERRIPAVFVESSVSEENVRALVEGARARGHAVTIGGQLFSDAMGAQGTWAGTYPGMIDHNVSVIVAALGGRVPGGGFRAWKEARR